MLDIGVVIPTHPARMVNGMMMRALTSVAVQELQPRRICVYNDVDRRGAPFARQQALEANPSEWTAFLDSDDWFQPRHLDVLARAQIETGADYVYSWFNIVGGADPFPTTHYTEPWDPANPRQTTITMLVRTELARAVGFWDVSDEETFPDGLRVGEDYHFTLECNRLGKIHHVIDRTWYWAHHGANTSGRPGQGDAR